MSRYSDYGLSGDEWAALLERAAGRCEVCKIAPHKHIDHDGATKRVRGLTCPPCNRQLGFVDRNHRTATPAEAAYLSKPQIGAGHRSHPPKPVRVSEDLWRRALAVARRRDESLSDVIRRALLRYVKRHE